MSGWLVLASLQSALAQGPNDLPASAPLPPVQEQSPPPKAPASPESALPPYEPQLDRLSELMGALAYLRDLCGQHDGADWRDQMTALLSAEATTPVRRERLAGAYNRGFRGYETTYGACTPSAELVILRFLDEGSRLTHELSTRFGGG